MNTLNDEYKDSKFILYLDTNSLNGGAMSQYLPYSAFKWLSQKEIDRLDVDSIVENSPIGFLLEVNLEYPDELHELHNDYPLAQKKLKIIHNMLWNYSNDIADKYGVKIGGVNKLVPNPGNKSKYVLHYRNL